MDSTIFISIASFIDTDLRNTILSCINQAKHPENLSFGVVLQYNNEEETNERCIDDLIEQYNIRVKKYWFEESQGGCWARNKVSSLYINENFVYLLEDLTINLAYKLGGFSDKKYLQEDKVVLDNDPRNPFSLNGVITTFPDCYLWIVQSLSDLNEKSETLKGTDYYNYWTQKQLDEVVTWRNHTQI